MQNKKESSLKVRAIELVWQHFLLIISLYFMTLGVALCVRSNLGSGVISAIPMVFSIAGEASLAPPLTIGGYTNIMNIILVCAQVLVLRRQFEEIQLLQLIIGFIFGMLLDINMALTSIFSYESLWAQIVAQGLGCTILAVAIAFEIR